MNVISQKRETFFSSNSSWGMLKNLLRKDGERTQSISMESGLETMPTQHSKGWFYWATPLFQTTRVVFSSLFSNPGCQLTTYVSAEWISISDCRHVRHSILNKCSMSSNYATKYNATCAIDARTYLNVLAMRTMSGFRTITPVVLPGNISHTSCA